MDINTIVLIVILAVMLYAISEHLKDKKSVAINVTLQAEDKTLSERDLDEISKQIIEVVKEKTGATIRS